MDKLEDPGELTDNFPGLAVSSPKAPGRPTELRFKVPGQAPTDFPGLKRLEQAGERGRLLHFFANHELLAAELMALVLLRFPDAPPAFRRGVAQTLRDEQAHTRLYIERMRECGVQFGEMPVSGFFWNAVSTMQNPLDYVAGLSLTFEQANLDFCRHFARGFESVGDSTTSGLLNRIYLDEISHVALGLNWFRRWKDPTASDWEAFCRQLKPPLSPRRAKGIQFNSEGRTAAGLDRTFIAELEAFSRSKGRTPNVFVFNPLSEAHLCTRGAFTPNRNQGQLVEDLETLPQFLAREDDVVLVRRKPRIEFMAHLQKMGFDLPEFVEVPNGRLLLDRVGHLPKVAGLRPWAWGPDSRELLLPLEPRLTSQQKMLERSGSREVKELYSKGFSADWLAKTLMAIQDQGIPVDGTGTVEGMDWLCPLEVVGHPASEVEEVIERVHKLREAGYQRLVAKAEFGLAGQNAIRLWEPQILPNQLSSIANVLATGVRLVVEPWLERLEEFSAQYEMTPTGLELRGFTQLVTDHRGQFLENRAEPNRHRSPPSGVQHALEQSRSARMGLTALYILIQRKLEAELKRRSFAGPIGIDAFVYRDAKGVNRLKPIVEFNPRYTMGRLTLELMRRVIPGAYGRFRLVGRPQLIASACSNFEELERKLAREQPIRLVGAAPSRIGTGAIVLTDSARAQSVCAVFEVGVRQGVGIGSSRPWVSREKEPLGECDEGK